MDWMEAIRRVSAFSELAGPITIDQFLKLIPSDTPAEEIERLMIELKAQGIEIAEGKAPTGTGSSCSFCGKKQPEVLQLIAGPGTFICDECIQLCVCMVAVKNPGWLEEHRQLLAKLPLKLNG